MATKLSKEKQIQLILEVIDNEGGHCDAETLKARTGLSNEEARPLIHDLVKNKKWIVPESGASIKLTSLGKQQLTVPDEDTEDTEEITTMATKKKATAKTTARKITKKKSSPARLYMVIDPEEECIGTSQILEDAEAQLAECEIGSRIDSALITGGDEKSGYEIDGDTIKTEATIGEEELEELEEELEDEEDEEDEEEAPAPVKKKAPAVKKKAPAVKKAKAKKKATKAPAVKKAKAPAKTEINGAVDNEVALILIQGQMNAAQALMDASKEAMELLGQ